MCCRVAGKEREMMKRTPAHVGRLQPFREKECFRRLTETEYLHGLLDEMSKSETYTPPGSDLIPPREGVDSGLIQELWETVGRLNFECVLFKDKGITIGQEYEDFLGSLMRKYGRQSKAPLNDGEALRMWEMQGLYVDAFIDDMLQIDTGEGYEQPRLGA